MRKGDVDDKELANTVSHAEEARESVISKSFQRASISLSPANRSHAVVSRRVRFNHSTRFAIFATCRRATVQANLKFSQRSSLEAMTVMDLGPSQRRDAVCHPSAAIRR